MGPNDLSHLLAVLFALLVATKVFGVLAQRLGQPSVVGELLAGVLLGKSLLGILDPADPVIHDLAQLGVIVLLFEIGLHTDVRSLFKAGPAAMVVAIVGVVIPFGLGYGVCIALGLAVIPAVVTGAALTATSIGISARTLSDLGQLRTTEGQIVLGAAVLDDIIGLVILSIVAGLVSGRAVSVGGVALTSAIAVGFIVVALVLGNLFVPPFFRFVDRVEASGTLGIAALAFAFLMAALAAMAGSATIIGAFAAGLVLHNTPQRSRIDSATTSLGHFFVPIFFAVVGAAVELGTLANLHALAIGGALVGVGIAGKVIAGFGPFWFKGRKLLIGVAMIPRGEVGLIFAQMGLATASLTSELYSAIALMVLVTTFVTPPFLALMVRSEQHHADISERPGDGGIDDLVAGAAQHRD
jgi:Kef-type K+ transport system membrane component KefB